MDQPQTRENTLVLWEPYLAGDADGKDVAAVVNRGRHVHKLYGLEQAVRNINAPH